MLPIADIADELMPSVKVALRVTDTYFDPEVEAALHAAIADMARVGVDEECFDSESAYYPLVRQAAIVYCKAAFGMDNPNAEMAFWRESYLMAVTDLLNSAANTHAAEEDGDALG